MINRRMTNKQVHRRIGGLETLAPVLIGAAWVHRRIGGLEIGEMQGIR